MIAAPTPLSFAHALRVNRLRLHRLITPSSVALTVASSLISLMLVWAPQAATTLIGWLAALWAVLAVRLGVWWRSRPRAGADETRGSLAGYRLAFALHGMAWAALPLLLPEFDHPGALQTVTFICVAMVGASLISASFDLMSPTVFSTPVVLSLALVLPGRPDHAGDGLAGIAAMFVLIMALSATRSAAMARSSVRATQAVQERTEQSERLAREAESARKALADKHALLQQLVRSTRQGFWFIDSDGKTLDVNDAMCEILGRTAEEVRGKEAHAFFSGAERAVLERELAKRRNGHVGSYQVDVVRPDGTRVPCLNNATPIHDEEGRRVGSIGLWTDLSEVKRQERELQLHAAGIQAMSDAVAVMDEERRYLMVNDAWTRITGIPREAAIGRTTQSILPGHVRTSQRLEAAEKCLRDQCEYTVRDSMQTASNGVRMVETRFHPFNDPAAGIRGVIMISRDITEEERVHEALQTSADYLRYTLNATGDGIFASDAAGPDQPVRFVNDQMLRMWNIPLEKAATLTPADIMAASMPMFSDPQTEARHIAEIVSHNKPDESRVRLRDGRVLARRCEPAQIGTRQLRVWSFRDVTAEERALALLNNRDQEQQALLAAFPGFIARLDGQLRITYANPRLAGLLGRSPAALLGRRAGDVRGLGWSAEREHDAALALDGDPVVYESRIGLREQVTDAQVTMARGVDPITGAPALYAFGVDITERKRAEVDLAYARDQAERANRAKSDFLSHLSHELRTPMNAIAGFSQLLLRDTADPLAGRHRTWVREILHGAGHLLELINETLDIGRIESGHLALEITAVPLRALIEECLAMTAALAGDRGVRIEPLRAGLMDLAADVQADRRRLKQVLINLVSNAIKYNHAGGWIALDAQVEDAAVVISVFDSGNGISAEDCARLFMPFERLGAERTQTEGSGIGLALSRQLVSAMEGEIGVDSVPGEGSRFWVRLPRAAHDLPAHGTHDASSAVATAEDAADGDSRRASAGSAQRTLLYVDDSAVNVMLMEVLLSDLPGLELVTASGPKAGLEAALQYRPDLILLDIHMPGMSGYEVLERLKAHADTADIPVVAVSADAMPADIQRARDAGFADYLCKPLDLERSLAVIRQTLQTGRPHAAGPLPDSAAPPAQDTASVRPELPLGIG